MNIYTPLTIFLTNNYYIYVKDIVECLRIGVQRTRTIRVDDTITVAAITPRETEIKVGEATATLI